jgi:RNA polymerase sigma factor (sigma-70 family)
MAIPTADGDLLERFAKDHDGDAFAELVRRHGPMVLGVCRGVLRHEQDAEDAFQATFLVLARKAASIRNRESLAGFLHQVAYHAAVDAREKVVRRRIREHGSPETCAPAPTLDMTIHDLQRAVHEELRRLPENYRLPLVLCYLEGYSHEEAARQLGWTRGALRGRLDRGREALRRQLQNRGLAPAATLCVAELILRPAPASAVDVLVNLSSAKAAALTAAMRRVLWASRIKICIGMLMAAALCAGVAALSRSASAAKEANEEGTAAPGQQGIPDKAATDAAQTLAFLGRVLDPTGKPSAGAKIHLFYYATHKVPMPVRAISDSEGRFHFTATRKEFDTSYSADPWNRASPVAVMDGFGLGLPRFDADTPSYDKEVTLQLARDDMPLNGRILDLQGKPVVGATVRVRGIRVPRSGELASFLDALQGQKEGFNVHSGLLTGFFDPYYGLNWDSLFARVITNAEGRFQINGIGRERIADLLFEGNGIETKYVYALTRATPRIDVPSHKKQAWNPLMTHYGANFDHVAAPSRPIAGVVRDKDTDKAIAGVRLQNAMLAGGIVDQRLVMQSVTDKEGRYRIHGMPCGQGNSLEVTPPADQPYLMMYQPVVDAPGLQAVKVDVALKRGIWIDVRVTDKRTGKAVPSSAEYNVFSDNPHLKELPGFTNRMHQDTHSEAGRFRLVGLPGRGLVSVWAANDHYLLGAGADKIKELQRGLIPGTTPRIVSARHTHGIVEVNPAADAEQVSVEVVLDPGRAIKGQVLGPDGKPLAGVLISGLDEYTHWGHKQWGNGPSKTADFTMTGLASGRTRLLQFAQLDKKLAGSLLVDGDAKGPLRVTLVPAGSLSGRVITRQGKPAVGGLINASRVESTVPDGVIPVANDEGSLPRPPRSDKDGRFRIDGLAPGLKYHLLYEAGGYLLRIIGPLGADLTVKAGETKDVGDLLVEPMQ